VSRLPLSGAQLRFCALFLLVLGLLQALFRFWQPLIGGVYMHLISVGAVSILHLLGVSARLDTTSIASGFCLVRLDTLTLRVIHECTGLFSLFILIAAICAYPAPAFSKVWGVFLGAGAFVLYSILRLTVLGLVAHLVPGRIPVFHIYLMVLLNLGFTVFLWLAWIRSLTRG
jgi:exosortase/archaeosortase family protein